MKIMVFDVPAESGGALSVLHDFYDEYKDDPKNEYIFVVSLPELKETNNIRVLKFPWIKKGWIHRLYFDHFIAPKLIKKYKADKVLSLQNITIPHTKVYHSVFVHNALPFSEYRFSFREEKLLWVYQNIISKNIKKSIKKADRVIVQSDWMKKKFVEQLKVSTEKIEVKRPKIDIVITEQFRETKESLSTFFYPASYVLFKNHKVIIDACIKLRKEGINDYKVIFTLNGDENKYIINLYNIIRKNDLPIEFVGSLTRKEVCNFYKKSTLIFPSYIETVGLPLIEAKMYRSRIIASDTIFVHEILSEYKNKILFDPFDSNSLSRAIKKSKIQSFESNKLEYKNIR